MENIVISFVNIYGELVCRKPFFQFNEGNDFIVMYKWCEWRTRRAGEATAMQMAPYKMGRVG